MISKTKKQKIIKESGVHDKDTGSPEVQISILTRRIEELASHLKKNQKVLVEVIKKVDLKPLFGKFKFKESTQKLKDEMKKGW